MPEIGEINEQGAVWDGTEWVGPDESDDSEQGKDSVAKPDWWQPWMGTFPPVNEVTGAFDPDVFLNMQRVAEAMGLITKEVKKPSGAFDSQQAALEAIKQDPAKQGLTPEYDSETGLWFLVPTTEAKQGLEQPETMVDAEGRTWARTQKGGAWQLLEDAPVPRTVQAQPPLSFDDLITDAIINGQWEKAVAYDDFRKRPSSQEAVAMALRYARSPDEFDAIYNALRQLNLPESVIAQPFAERFGVDADQAARIVQERAQGERQGFPAGPLDLPGGFPRVPTAPQGVGQGFARPAGDLESRGFDSDRYYTDPAYRESVDAALAAQGTTQPASGGTQAKALPPGVDAERYRQDPQYRAAWDAALQAQTQGFPSVRAVGEDQGFVNDISQMSPQELQSQFGPIAGPTWADIEGLSQDELMKAYGITPEERERLLKSRPKKQGYPLQTLRGFARASPGAISRPRQVMGFPR